MKTLLGACSAALALSFASFSFADDPHFAPWGFDLAGRDTSVTPGDDFYAYADGTYVKNLQIPADRARFGNFAALQALSEDRLHALLDKASANSDLMSEAGKVGAFYRAYMDERRTRRPRRPAAAPELAPIRAAAHPPAHRRADGPGREVASTAACSTRHRRRRQGPGSTTRSTSARAAWACPTATTT